MITFKRLLLLVPFLLLLVVPVSASAVSPSPGWTLNSLATPSDFAEGNVGECAQNECGNLYNVFATNTGSEPTDGEPIVIVDTLPSGVAFEGASLTLEEGEEKLQGKGDEVDERVGACGAGVSVSEVVCSYSGVVAPDGRLQMQIGVGVSEARTPQGTLLSNSAVVSGGGATATASAQSSNEVNAAPASFDVSGFSFYKAALDGAPEAQAGGHPYELVTTIDLNNGFKEATGLGKSDEFFGSPEYPKDIVVDLPLGFAGSTLSAPECTESQLLSVLSCPSDTVVGHLTTEPSAVGTAVNGPIYNMVPEHGFPAEFGYVDVAKGAHVFYTHVVPTPEGYVLQTTAYDIPEVLLDRIVVTFYGDPALRDAEAKQQEQERALLAKAEARKHEIEIEHIELNKELHSKGEEELTFPPVELENTHVKLEEPSVQVPFFTDPTACSNGPQVAKVWIDSWQDPARIEPGGYPVDLNEPQWKKAESVTPAVSGCNTLTFTPQIGSQPTTHEADSPSGLEFEQRLPQTETVGTNATPALKDTTIVFPPGMTVDPSSADGLGTCSLAQIGWQGHAPAQPGELYDFTENKPECPESSKIGTLELETPLISGKLYGEVFLAGQNENPFDSTFATYIVVNDPTTGVVLKLAGEVKLCANAGEVIDGRACQAAGQITATFDETPQLPFSDLKVHFFGGPRSEFATPPNCGTYTTNSELIPWSAPGSGLPPTPFDNYVIDEDCAIGFDPAFTGGSTNLQAGAYTTFQASFEREDDDQELAGAEVSLPPGLLANVPSVTECGEAELAAEAADAPTGGCPASSQVGTVEAGAGPGPNPLFVPGKAFFTGPHNGGPYGLAVVVSANPGPFHFGNVVVRQSLRINPFTAAVTDVSDPFPTFIDPRGTNGQVNGIPIKLRRVDVEIGGLAGKPFTFNPTNCAKGTFQVGGAITSVQGASKTLATPFQVTNCATLKFAPKFAVATTAKNSKANGTSLTAKLSYPSAPQGTYADIARVKVELPKALPSRLTTLQKACTLIQFDTNPANCPSESKIGYAIVHTPILPGSLSGPAIFVSHGGEAFPTLTMVLQGDGVTVEIVGTTYISKAGVTSTTFKTVPDSPFSTFELTLPEGKYSALTALGNLCTQKLVMPSEFVAQNGAEIHIDTPVSVGGCPKVKALTRAQKLAKALKACKKDHNKAKRQSCEGAARKKYGPKAKSKSVVKKAKR
jgi:hypothetical protein